MFRKHWSLGILIAILVLELAFIGIVTRQEAVASPSAQQPIPVPTYYWSYATKFVCGFQDQPAAGLVGEPPVKPGNYATEINIHNPNYKTLATGGLPIYKKLVVLVGTAPTGDPNQPEAPFAWREPETARPGKFEKVTLGPDYATMDDCDAIWRMANATGIPLVPGRLTIGYLVTISALELDIDAVYTAEVPGHLGTTPTGISIDVERTTGKRITLPATTLPAGAQAEAEELLKQR